MRRGVVWLVLASACSGDADPPDSGSAPPPDVPAARVHRVGIGLRGGVQVVSPSTLRVESGASVQFVTTDWHVHTVRFLLDSLDAPARAFLSETRQDGSPPLVEPDARFVVDFADAPAGRYPYVVEGGGEARRGAVVVLAPGGA